MRRRELTLLLGGAAISWPRALRAQQKRMPVVGYLSIGSARSVGPGTQSLAAFRQGLSETGYVEGQNVAIEYRGAEGHYDRLPALAAGDRVRQASARFGSAAEAGEVVA